LDKEELGFSDGDARASGLSSGDAWSFALTAESTLLEKDKGAAADAPRSGELSRASLATVFCSIKLMACAYTLAVKKLFREPRLELLSAGAEAVCNDLAAADGPIGDDDATTPL
jgi:hypothetical protein